MIKNIKNIFGYVSLSNPDAKINNKGTMISALFAVAFFSSSFFLTDVLPSGAYYSLISCGSIFGLICVSRLIQSFRLLKLKNIFTTPDDKIVTISGEIYEKILNSLEKDAATKGLSIIEYEKYQFQLVSVHYSRGEKAKNYLKEFYKNSARIDHYHSFIILASVLPKNMAKNSLGRFAVEVDLNTRLAIAQVEEMINVTFPKFFSMNFQKELLEKMKGEWPSKEAFEGQLKNFYRSSNYLLGNS